ncbi:Protein Smg [bioreactor metagenome]|uniref:Protein Smg n=1 Tax=bioreactor metagenome TaxID=1076179 RepID=A0A645C102_9ZZZZ
MSERIIDVIVWVILQLKTDKLEDIKMKNLLEQGFTEKEISTAFSWLMEKLESDSPNEFLMLQAFPSKAFRVFQDTEKDFFTKDAYGSIVRLLSIGLISNEHVEMMIHTAEAFGFQQISDEMVKQYVAVYMFGVPPPNHIGSRLTLSAYDKIN